MDRRLFALAELIAFAGILAGGHTIVASAGGGAGADRQETAREAPLPVQNGKLAAGHAAPIVTTRPPVPLLLSSRSPQPGQPSEEGQSAESTSDGTVPDQTDKKVSSDAAAKAMIEADGYKNVRVVSEETDGSWRAVAMRGSVEVAVSVDGDGNVTTQ